MAATLVTLKLMTIIGSKGFYQFIMNDDTIGIVQCTYSEYRALELNNSTPALQQGAKNFYGGFSRNLYDTFSGDPEAGSVEKFADGSVMVWMVPLGSKYKNIGSNVWLLPGEFSGTPPNITNIAVIPGGITITNGVMMLP